MLYGCLDLEGFLVITIVICARIILLCKKGEKGVCVYSNFYCHILLVFWYGNLITRNNKVGLIGYSLRLCLWRVLIGFIAIILVVRKKIIWCIDQIVLFRVLFWWVGTSFCGRWGMFPGGSLCCIQSRIYICVLVVQLLIYVMILVMRLGGWIWWCCLGPRHRVLLKFRESIGLAEFSKVSE